MCSSGIARMSSASEWASSAVAMNGIRRLWNSPVNCESSELPSVSAVIPVLSETKNTWRLGLVTAVAKTGGRGLPSPSRG